MIRFLENLFRFLTRSSDIKFVFRSRIAVGGWDFENKIHNFTHNFCAMCRGKEILISPGVVPEEGGLRRSGDVVYI